MRWTNWTLVGLGIWLILSPWVLGFSAFNLPAWNSVLFGALVAIFSFWDSSES